MRNLYGFFCGRQKLAIAVYNYDIFTSTDGGATWTNDTTGLGNLPWELIASSADGEKLAATEDNDIWTSTDGGATWTNETTGTSLSSLGWGGITSSANGADLVAGTYGTDIYTSTNGGATWIAQAVGLNGLGWSSITSSSDGTKLAAVQGGGDIWTAVLSNSAPTTESPPAGNGAPAGLLSPGALTSLPSYVTPRLQTRYPDGRVTYPAAATSTASSSASYDFTQNHQLYDVSSDIKALQEFLNTHGFTITTSGPGSPGSETDFFGVKTFQALIKFQKANDLPATGFFGPLTRALIASLQ